VGPSLKPVPQKRIQQLHSSMQAVTVPLGTPQRPNVSPKPLLDTRIQQTQPGETGPIVGGHSDAEHR
ncbi:hypothetical protein, partial [Nocardia pseudovaccinii]|uniref:hypothetical protein n=1 Tax=Nocardia pseudovaccinii TaxID=189540 RepID=UPI001C3F8E91